MSVVEPGGSAALVERAKNLLLAPATEWERIKGEQTSLQTLVMGYVLPLAAAAALCTFIGQIVFSRFLLTIALSGAITQLVLAGVGVYVFGLILNAIAPSFGAAQNQAQAFKIAAYSTTAAFVGAMFLIVPALGVIALIGAVYSLYLLWVGLPLLMSPAADKKVSYYVTALVIWVLVAFVIATVMTGVQRIFVPAPAYVPF